MINQIHCPFCKSKLKTIFTTKDYLVRGEKFDIVECSDCRLRMTNPFPDKEKIGNYYESDVYISHAEESKGIFDSIYNMVRSYMLGRKRKIVENSSGIKQGSLLDIGCGAGHFLSSLKENGWNVKGVDASQKARELVKSQFDIHVASPKDWLNSDKKYDVITCWHSLEHVYEPWVYLEKIKTQLNPDGVFIVALPNYESTDGNKYGANWAAYDTPRHLYHFTPTSMEKIMFNNEFLIDEIHRMPFDAFYVSILSSQHMEKSMISGIWNGFVSWLSCWVNKEKCSSLIYVMK
jgi:SAM-dependent methyltransferase